MCALVCAQYTFTRCPVLIPILINISQCVRASVCISDQKDVTSLNFCSHFSLVVFRIEWKHSAVFAKAICALFLRCEFIENARHRVVTWNSETRIAHGITVFYANILWNLILCKIYLGLIFARSIKILSLTFKIFNIIFYTKYCIICAITI